MKNIDYKSYLESLGDFETNQKIVIKKYLEEQCKTDEALKEAYKEEEIDNCYIFISNCVREKSKSNSVCVEDAVVYKMARDYFIEILSKPDAEEKEVVTNSNATCGTCGNNYQDDECVIKHQKVEAGEKACNEYIRKATDEDIQKIKEENQSPEIHVEKKKIKKTKKEEKKDDGQLFFEF